MASKAATKVSNRSKTLFTGFLCESHEVPAALTNLNFFKSYAHCTSSKKDDLTVLFLNIKNRFSSRLTNFVNSSYLGMRWAKQSPSLWKQPLQGEHLHPYFDLTSLCNHPFPQMWPLWCQYCGPWRSCFQHKNRPSTPAFEFDLCQNVVLCFFLTDYLSK